DAGIVLLELLDRNLATPDTRVVQLDVIAPAAGVDDPMRELPVEDRGPGLEHVELVDVHPDAARAQPDGLRRLHDRERAHSVARRADDVAHLFEAHLFAEVAEHHGEARRAAFGRGELMHHRDRAFFPEEDEAFQYGVVLEEARSASRPTTIMRACHG